MKLSNIVDQVELGIIQGLIRSKKDLEIYLTELNSEDKLDSVYTEMLRRKSKINNLYPFKENDGLFTMSKEIDTDVIYYWLLLVSLNANTDHTNNAAILDIISIEALRNLYGKNCSIINFSSPLRYGSKRPNKFVDAIKYLGKEIGLTTCVGYKIPNRKDGGVDLVLYNDILGTKALPVTLVQTTTQIKYFEKINDIDVKLWQNWINLGPDPIRMLVSSMTATDDDYETAHSSGFVFIDRLRLINLVYQKSPKLKFDNIFFDIFNDYFLVKIK